MNSYQVDVQKSPRGRSPLQLCIRKGDLKDLIKGEINLDRRNHSVVDNAFSQSNIEIHNDVELEKA